MSKSQPDPKRIERVIEKLWRAWCKYPNMRLGQFIDGAASQEQISLFYLSDEDLEKWLDKWRGDQ